MNHVRLTTMYEIISISLTNLMAVIKVQFGGGVWFKFIDLVLQPCPARAAERHPLS